MSNDPQTPESGDALDLSGLSFGPAWARDKSESKPAKKYQDRPDRGDSRDRRGGGGGRRDDRRGGGGRGRDQRGGGGDRRGGGGGGQFQGGRGRRDDRGPQREEIPAPEGFGVSFMPSEESLDLLAKEVTQTGRTFSVFDLAKVLLQGRDRFRVTFEHKDKNVFRCREDNSVWLTKEEAIRHLWKADWRSKFYTEVQVEGEAPKGSFQSVGKCGMSGKYLGPPNYHAYQQNVAAIHREQFGNMPLERYKSKIVMERGEDAVNAWLESMKITTQWKIAEPEAEEKPAAEEKEETPEAKVKEAAPPEAEVTEEATPEIAEEPAAEETEAPAAEESEVETAAEDAPEAEEAFIVEATEVELFKTARDVEQHFLANHFEAAFEETNRAWVMGDIQGKHLSPGLLTLLKNSVIEEKRYPANLMPIVCRQLSGRHVAVFKWAKKLKVGPSRPHAVAPDAKLSERLQAIIDYLKENSGKKLQELWEKFLPEGSTDEVKGQWYHDLHWLLNQGHAILLSDTTLHLSKSGDGGKAPAKKSAKKAAKKAKKPVIEEKPSEAAKEEAPQAKAPEEKAPEEKAPEPAVEDAPVAEATPAPIPAEEKAPEAAPESEEK
ncbi:hypothetical protein N9Z88_03935 [Akkermansiaceae bacterium]|nr:hypothetical protein [Akkermansiaceae bacterium]